VRGIAALLGIARSSVNSLISHGFLPGGTVGSHRRGGRELSWTGTQLLRIARRPIRIAYDHETYAPTTLYRVGCRCPTCTAAHTDESVARKRALSEEAFSAAQRRQVLDLVAAGASIPEAAGQAETSPHQVYGRALWDPEFADELDDAGWALCALGQDHPKCGTAGAYRGSIGGAVGKACRGTGCREWRRDSSRRERA
jgi:hypothetical protein